MNAPTLYLIPTFLSDEGRDVLPESVLSIIRSLDEFIVEKEKTARYFLKSIGTPVAQANLKFHILDEHSTLNDIQDLKKVLKQNKNIGLLSEAGCPGVADPGASVVSMAHQLKMKVRPLTGPSSILLSLMASGFNGQSFVFDGYLPRESAARKGRIRELEKSSNRTKQTRIFIETPYRNQSLFRDILEVCQSDTNLCIACSITSPHEWIKTATVAEWKKNTQEIPKEPCVFLIGNTV